MAKRNKTTAPHPTARRETAARVASPAGKPPEVAVMLLGELAGGLRPTVQYVPLSKIAGDGPTHRQAKGDVEALAKSMTAVGLLQPIGLVETAIGHTGQSGPRYAILYGRRRLEAARTLGWPTIQALTYDPRVGADAGMVRRLEAIENIERADLNPVEEVLAVSRLLESITGRKAAVWTDAAPEHLERAAALLGRTVPWVRDRAYLTRLCPAVQAMVADRRLPLAQAREIAKLASAEEQTNIAGFATRLGMYGHEAEAGEHHIESVAGVRRMVAERLSTLRGVPWEPGVAFAGRPACHGCLDNSANAVLFGIDKDDKAPEARCLNVICYRAKMKAAEQAVAKTVSHLKARKDVAATPAAVRDIAPDYVKPATVARHLAQARGVEPKAAPAKAAGAKATPYVEPPESKLRNALGAWRAKIEDLAALRIVADPRRLICLILARAGQTIANHVQWWVPEASQKVRKAVDPVLKRIAAATPAAVAALAADVKAKGMFSAETSVLPLWIVRRLAGLLDVNLPPAPVLKDFLPPPAKENK